MTPPSQQPRITPIWGDCYLKVTFGPGVRVATTSPTAERTGCVGDPPASGDPVRPTFHLKTNFEDSVVYTSGATVSLPFTSELS